MTVDEQLEGWVLGNPQHNPDRDECCPDFSCCQPELLAPVEVRQKFAAADGPGRHAMLMMFLGAAVATLSDRRVVIAGDGHEAGVQ